MCNFDEEMVDTIKAISQRCVNYTAGHFPLADFDRVMRWTNIQSKGIPPLYILEFIDLINHILLRRDVQNHFNFYVGTSNNKVEGRVQNYRYWDITLYRGNNLFAAFNLKPLLSSHISSPRRFCREIGHAFLDFFPTNPSQFPAEGDLTYTYVPFKGVVLIDPVEFNDPALEDGTYKRSFQYITRFLDRLTSGHLTEFATILNRRPDRDPYGCFHPCMINHHFSPVTFIKEFDEFVRKNTSRTEFEDDRLRFEEEEADLEMAMAG